ncbi:unnamed protein product, partial [Linum tenue]
KLRNWGKLVDASCVLCGSEVETRDHLFFACEYSRRLLADLFGVWPAICYAANWQNCLDIACSLADLPGADGKVGSALWCLVVGYVWKEPCRRVHGEAGREVSTLLTLIQQDLEFSHSSTVARRSDLQRSIFQPQQQQQ